MSILDAITPYKLLIEVAVVGSALLWFAEHERDVGRAEVRAEWKAADVARVGAEQKLAAAQTATRDLAVAQGEQRDQTLNAAIAASTAATVGLRNTVAAQRTQLATATVETARLYAGVASTVFAECTERYRSVAAEAERNANAARTLSEAWPVAPINTK